MSGTKHHPVGMSKGADVDKYAGRLQEKERDPRRVPSYGSLRCAMNHLISENARLRAQVHQLEKAIKGDLTAMKELAEKYGLDAEHYSRFRKDGTRSSPAGQPSR